MPCAVYGFTEDLNARMEACKRAAPDGHSGIGTTLSASLLAMAALHANLTDVMTPAHYATMLAGAAAIEQQLRETLRTAGVPWTVTRLGPRMELQFCSEAPRNGQQARDAMDDAAQGCPQLLLLNRGVVITPFQNMLLVSPQTTVNDAEPMLAALAEFIAAVRA